ncbi:hypothetical protein [Halorarum salinum]|uniref:Uncharacterized protein n=1 Tax=Halorarum salinum TaxID=2743089 RepID=A0A7D5LC71_9EURY|nr:hypothetical protein [Halobaculum salinum]QLG63068.1 hypothetical protein HUG12_15540 [Halobaculum salinum]
MLEAAEIGKLEDVEIHHHAEDVKAVRLIGAEGTAEVEITDESMSMFVEVAEDVFGAIHADMANLRDTFDRWEPADDW